MIRIVLADDHPVVLDGLRRFFSLQQDLSVLAAVKNKAELVDAITTHAPDVIIVDLNMEGMQGAESIRELVQSGPAVIVFSMQEEDAYSRSLVKLGAAAFLNKSRSPDELASAIRAAARGERGSAEPAPTLPHEAFSPREREVFERLIDGQSPKEIAFALGLSPSTVHTYSERIRDKLGVDSHQALVAYAFKHRLRR